MSFEFVVNVSAETAISMLKSSFHVKKNEATIGVLPWNEDTIRSHCRCGDFAYVGMQEHCENEDRYVIRLVDNQFGLWKEINPLSEFTVEKPFILDDGLIYFAYVILPSDVKIAAVVAVPRNYFSTTRAEKDQSVFMSGYFYGLMDQAIRHHPLLKLFSEWDFLNDSWSPVELAEYATIVL